MNVYMYCADRSVQKEIKDEIERDTGVNIRRTVRNIDPSKDYGVGIIIMDDMLDLDIKFKPSDIIVTLKEMDFQDWLYLTERGIEVVKCDNGFSNLKWALRVRGADGVDASDEFNSGRVVTKKSSIKDYYIRFDGGIYAFYSVDSGVGRSTIVYNYAKKLKGLDSSKRVLVIDRVKQFSSIQYMVETNSRFEKVGGIVDNLYKDTKTDVFVYSPNNSVKLIKNTGTTDIVNVVDNLKKHFDYILIDADSLFDSDLMDIIEICTHTYIVTDDNKEAIYKSVNLIDNTLSKINKPDNYTVLVNKYNGGDTSKIHYKKIEIPYVDKIAVNKSSKIYIEDAEELNEVIIDIIRSNGGV